MTGTCPNMRPNFQNAYQWSVQNGCDMAASRPRILVDLLTEINKPTTREPFHLVSLGKGN